MSIICYNHYGGIMNKLTGRKIAIFTDVHALKEPLQAIIDDINKRKINEIYSLGDNIGVGPNPKEVLKILKNNNVNIVCGNAEYYCTLGISPFQSYFDSKKIASQEWTISKLTKDDIEEMAKYPSSIDLNVGNKKIALCHFANDVRIDYTLHSTWTYQDKINRGNEAYLQFKYTNSEEQKRDILKNKDNPKDFCNGFRSSFKDPLFGGKSPFEYDYVFQGHVHFKSIVKSPSTIFFTVGMAYKEKNIATYIILNEMEEGFEIEEVFVTFKREKMLESVNNSDMIERTLLDKYLAH